MIKPIPLRTLLEDEAFRRYMKTLPALPDNLAHGKPWAVIVHRTDGRWMMGKFATYQVAWQTTIRALRDADTADVSLVSRRRLFLPPTRPEQYRLRITSKTGSRIETRTRSVPVLAHLIEYPYEWCVRCRRPSSFEQFARHHAIPANVPIDATAVRCVFCGMRLTV